LVIHGCPLPDVRSRDAVSVNFDQVVEFWGEGAVISYLAELEAQSIHILREAVAQAENPVMLYSIGKDSTVMLHLARKAFFPAP